MPGLLDWLRSLLPRGRSAPAALPPAPGPDGDDPLLTPSGTVQQHGWTSLAEMLHGRLHSSRVQVQTRWTPLDQDTALHQAEQGTLLRLAQLLDAMKRDGLIRGIMETRTLGLIRLPVQYTGDPWLVSLLRGAEARYDAEGVEVAPAQPGAWSTMMPQSELAALLWDGIMAGVGVGELVPRGDEPPVLRHLDLHWVTYQHASDTWHYQTTAGRVLIEPGNGRWVLFTPYGRDRPWIRGAWWSCALPWISKFNATMDRMRWQNQLADPLKVIEAGPGADEKHRRSLLDFVRNVWRRAAGLVTPPGYKASLVESNGRGYEVYKEAEERADIEIQVALDAQTTMTTGSSGFSSGNVWRDRAAAMIAGIAEALSTTIHQQITGPWAARWHASPGRAPMGTWDLRSPEQRTAEAEALGKLAAGVTAMDAALAPRGERLDLDAWEAEHGASIPRVRLDAPVKSKDLFAYHLEYGLLSKNEARAMALDLPPVAGGTATPLPASQATDGAVAALPPARAPLALPPASTLDAAASEDAPPTPDAAQRLADKMTEHGIERCQHDAPNRCRICGVERERDFVPGVDGAPHQWLVRWRPIATAPAAAVG